MIAHYQVHVRKPEAKLLNWRQDETGEGAGKQEGRSVSLNFSPG